jgi:putative FmdB family regulatory protein
MPLFDYKCPQCGRTREVLVRRHDDLVPCDGECNRGAVKLDGSDVVFDLVLMERQQAAPSFRVEGFSARNNYSKLDTGFRKSAVPGIKTRVSGDHIDID